MKLHPLHTASPEIFNLARPSDLSWSAIDYGPQNDCMPEIVTALEFSVQVRFSHLDLGTAQYLDTESGELRPRSDLLRKLNRLRSKEKNV